MSFLMLSLFSTNRSIIPAKSYKKKLRAIGGLGGLLNCMCVCLSVRLFAFDVS
jgi:hypothetical protein